MTVFRKMRLIIIRDGDSLFWLALILVGGFLGAGTVRLLSVRPEPEVRVQTIYLAKAPVVARPAIDPAAAAPKDDMAFPLVKAGPDMVVIVSLPGKKNGSAAASGKKQWSEEKEFGITTKDVQHIATCFDNIAEVAIVRDLRKSILGKDGITETSLFAVTPSFLEVTHGALKGDRGRWFSHVDMETKAHVCVLGIQAAAKLFGLQDPVGQEVTISEVGFKVIGIIENASGRKIGDTAINDLALVPLDTANAAFGLRTVAATSTRWRKVYARVDCDYLFIRVADLRQIDNTVNRLRSYFQATHETQDYEILNPQ